MAITTINESDYIKDSRTVINNNFTELDTNKAPLNSPALTGTPTAPTPTPGDDSTKLATTAYVQAELADHLPLSGGTMTGSIMFTGANNRRAGIDLNNSGKNFDIGWNWTNKDGAGFYLRSTDFSSTAGGGFGAYARNATKSCDLFGNPNGSLTWNGTSFTVGGGTGTITGNITGNVLTGYTKPSVTSALAATDTLNGALGKLEKALDAMTASEASTGTSTTARTITAKVLNDLIDEKISEITDGDGVSY